MSYIKCCKLTGKLDDNWNPVCMLIKKNYKMSMLTNSKSLELNSMLVEVV